VSFTELLARLSLRARLVLGVIALATAGLAVANVVTYASLRSFLIEQTDRDLEQSHTGVERELMKHGCGRDDGRPFPGSTPGDYIELRDSGGVVCDAQIRMLGEQAQSPPELPGNVGDVVSGLAPGEATYLTVDSRDGGSRYRVRASVVPGNGTTLVLARSLEGVDETLGRLLLIELTR
jgi:hypothetical protein